MVAGLTLPTPAAVGDEWGNALNVAVHSVNADVEAIKARTIGAGLGLTGGGDLTANRSLAVDFAASGVSSATKAVRADDSRLSDSRTPLGHTHAYNTLTGIPATFAPAAHGHAQADVTNLVADLAAKAAATRVITAGSGLTGGGDLTADRTLAVNFATATPLTASPAGAVGVATKSAREDHRHPVEETTVDVPRSANVNATGLGPQVYLRGRMATMTIEIGVAAIIPAATALLTLPAGYRPVTRIYFLASGGRLCYVSTDGTVKNTSDTAVSAMDGSVTFPVA